MNDSRTSSPQPHQRKGPLSAAETADLQLNENREKTNRSAYWQQHLSDAPALILPILKPGGQNLSSGQPAQRSSSSLAAALRNSLSRISREEHAPLSLVLLGALYVLFSRYTSQDDLVIGCSLPDFRLQPEDAENSGEKETLLRIDLADDPTFAVLLQRIQLGLLESWSHEHPLPRLISELKATSFFHSGALPLYFSWRTSQHSAHSQSALSGGAPVDLRLEVVEGDLQLTLVSTRELMDPGAADRFLTHFQNLLSSIAENPEQTVSRLRLLGEAEKHQILIEWNNTACDYPHEQCLHHLIEGHAKRSPEKAALVHGEVQLSYAEFNTRANQLAHYLQSRGAGPNQRVAICLDPSPEFAIAVLAVLKAGAACVPLDPQYPKERLAHMLNDAQPCIVITQKDRLSQSALAEHDVLFFPDSERLLPAQSHTNPQSGALPEDIAYVIYTSGSTGKPRGVLLTHAGLVNYGTNATKMYAMTAQDRVLQFCSISFDIAVEELLIAWLSGATLVLRTSETPLAVPDFLDWVERQNITVLDLPTAYWHEWINEFAQLKRPVPREVRLVIVGGEKPSSQAYAKWLDSVGHRVRWINTYGPTEITICATAFEPSRDSAGSVFENIPIGRPLANARVYLLDRHLNPVPVGLPGELHVAGVGVARGYLNRPELTAEKFIPDPFSSEAGARLYKTGDLARYLASGEIEFLGRSDDQIKIRGFRIELGEIESALGSHPSIREVVVIARQNGSGEKQLVAYFVPSHETKLSSAELRRYVREQLPEYMVPSAFVPLNAMPLTPNGKLDRRGLPAPIFEVSPHTSAAPQNALQGQLVKIWQDVLGKKPIGIRDNFFELGGHSILAARLMHRTGQALGKTLPLAMLFRAPTVESLAAVLSKDEWSDHWSSLVPIQPLGFQPPFFCIHGVGGNVVGFHRLGRQMSPDYPFYGLQSRGLDGKQACFTSVEAMAAHYITEMRSVQPRGPYFLGGFSFGGLVGYEIAQQLRAMGEEAALLVLFDTYPGSVNPGLGSVVKMLLTPSRQRWFHQVPRALNKKLRRTWRNLRVPQALWDVHNANRAAAAQYVLRPYAGRVTLIRATETPLDGSIDVHAAWNTLAESLVVHEISSDHYDLLLEPQVEQLALRLKIWIDNARSEYEHKLAGTAAV
jgi:amino acid adenylation domain-containing protein